MANLRTPLENECFKLEIELLLDARCVAELLNASFMSPEELRGNPIQVRTMLLNAVGKKLAEQGVDFSDDLWTFDKLKARPRPGYCTCGLVFIWVSVKARRL